LAQIKADEDRLNKELAQKAAENDTLRSGLRRLAEEGERRQAALLQERAESEHFRAELSQLSALHNATLATISWRITERCVGFAGDFRRLHYTAVRRFASPGGSRLSSSFIACATYGRGAAFAFWLNPLTRSTYTLPVSIRRRIVSAMEPWGPKFGATVRHSQEPRFKHYSRQPAVSQP